MSAYANPCYWTDPARVRPADPTMAETLEALRMVRLEAQVAREQAQMLRTVLEGVRRMAYVETINGNEVWQKALDPIDRVLRMTA